MALTISSVSARLKTKLLNDEDSAAQDNEALQSLCDAIAETIVEELQANAVVDLTGVVDAEARPLTGTGVIL